MNTFVAINGLVYVMAAGYSVYQGKPWWGFVWCCYGLSAMALAALEGGWLRA